MEKIKKVQPVKTKSREPSEFSMEQVQEYHKYLDGIPDDKLGMEMGAFAPWSSGHKVNRTSVEDEDGFTVTISLDDLEKFSEIHKMCWSKFNKNPQINSHVRDVMGSLTGYGWGISSDIPEINDVINEEVYDIRNELYKNIPKCVARSEVAGELFLLLTLHSDGFVEVDFMDPEKLKGGENGSGIYFHPTKKTMPVFYNFSIPNKNAVEKSMLIPSVYVAHLPKVGELAINHHSLKKDLLKESVNTKYKSIGGYKRFIVSWDKGYFTKRNVSHIRTTIEWINHYENLKKWEIDHKKSSGSYLWVVKITDPKALRTWLKMTDDQKKETGLVTPKTPGSTLILPPGMEINCTNPSLSAISEQDTDIMHMVTSGLNKPEDLVTGQTKGDTFSGIKASRGPQSDRTQDQIAYFERWLRWDLFRSIYVLRAAATDFKLEYKVKEAIAFKNKKPVFKNVLRSAWELTHFDFPTSDISDAESKARAYLGSSHASIVESLGIPPSDVAKKLGFGSYAKRRLKYATEEEAFPELATSAELRMAQSSIQQPKDTKKQDTTDTTDNTDTMDNQEPVVRKKIVKKEN